VGSSPEVGTFFITMRDDENRSTVSQIDKQRMASISIFRNTFEEMIDKLLGMRLTSAPMYGSSSIGGIVNHVNNSGITIPYGQMIQVIQDINAQFKK